MNQNLAALLILICTVAAWVWPWYVLAKRRQARGGSPFSAHLIGALVGSAAAFGAFCLSGFLWMSDGSETGAMAVGALGALVLGVCLCVLYVPAAQRTAQALPQAKVQPDQVVVVVGIPVTLKVATAAQHRRTLKQAWHIMWQKDKRNLRDEILGTTSLFEFFVDRLESHVLFWGVVLFLTMWGWLFATLGLEMGWGARLLVGGFLACIVFCVLAITVVIPLAVILPLAWVSLCIEAVWRIYYNNRFVSEPFDASGISPAPMPSKSAGSWLVPLLFGVWLGRRFE